MAGVYYCDDHAIQCYAVMTSTYRAQREKRQKVGLTGGGKTKGNDKGGLWGKSKDESKGDGQGAKAGGKKIFQKGLDKIYGRRIMIVEIVEKIKNGEEI